MVLSLKIFPCMASGKSKLFEFTQFGLSEKHPKPKQCPGNMVGYMVPAPVAFIKDLMTWGSVHLSCDSVQESGWDKRCWWETQDLSHEKSG